MKKVKLIISTGIFVMFMSVSINAAPVFFGFGGEKIIKVADLPDTKEYFMENGQFLDVGYVYKQVSIFFVPVWNYDGKWAGYVGSDEFYIPLTKAELDAIVAEANVTLPDTPPLSFWETVGGKLVVGLIFLIIFAWKILVKRIETQGEDTDGKTFENSGKILSI